MRRFYVPRIPLGNTSLVIPSAPLNVSITGPNIFVINPAQGATKFHPGNGGWFDNQYWNQAEGTQYTAHVNEFKSDATLKHLEIVLTWAQLEGAQGDYSNGFAIIDGILANLRTAATPTYLTIKWWHAQFNTTSVTDASAWPAYVIAKGNWIKGFTSSSGVVRNQLDFDNDQIWTVLTAMFKAYGDRYDSEPLFEMIAIMDESDAVTVTSTGATILNGTHYNAKYKQLFLDVKAHWLHTLVWSTLNFLPPGGAEAVTAMQDIIVSFRAAYPGGFAFGGPDPAMQGVHGGGPTNWITTFQNMVAGQVGTLGDIRGQIVLVSHIEEYLLGNTGSPPTAPPVTPTQLMNSAVDIYKAQYVFWNYENWEFYKWADELAAIHARNGITNSAPSEGNFTSGGPTITDLWVALQGQTAPGQATIGGTNNSSLFGSVGSMTLAGTVQAGAFPIAGCNIYRSEDLFATRTKLNSSLIPVSGGAFSYRDDTAANCVATFCGGSTNPQSGAPALWWPARNYRYKVEAVDSQGTVGPLSATQKMYAYNFSSGGQNNPTINGLPAGGMKYGGDLGGGFELSYNDTGANETGRAILVGDNNGYWLPTTGWIYPQWAEQVGGTDYFYIDVNFAIVGGLTLHAELNPNDHKIDLLPSAHAAPGNAPGSPSLDLTAYCYAVNGVPDARWPNMPMSAIPTGVYCTFKVPRTHYMTDAGTLQNCVYKWLINKWGISIGNGTRFDKIFHGP